MRKTIFRHKQVREGKGKVQEVTDKSVYREEPWMETFARSSGTFGGVKKSLWLECGRHLREWRLEARVQPEDI